MEHFDITQWADYVRGLTASPEREAIERHVAGGCELCAHLLALVTHIQAEAAAEVEVPERLVQRAKTVFPARSTAPAASPVRAWLSLPRLAARLVFDGMSGLAQEGARRAPQSMMQLVYQAGPYGIELQIEREPESPEVVILGQVVNRSASERPVSSIPVLLLARNKLVAQTETSRFGEFCLVSRAQQRLKLAMPIESAGQRVEIALTRIAVGDQ
jgi:anti-sigma factor RsiW